jgi:hypothetical protein
MFLYMFCGSHFDFIDVNVLYISEHHLLFAPLNWLTLLHILEVPTFKTWPGDQLFGVIFVVVLLFVSSCKFLGDTLK